MMNDIQHLPLEDRLFEAAPSMPSVPPSLLRALADSQYVYDGGPAWTPEQGLDAAQSMDAEDQIAIARADLQATLAPAPPRWFSQRLPVLWTLFMASREGDPRALTVWLRETAYLLGDLPHDIAAHSIDEAIRKSCHGFIPSIGEIRLVAEPLVAERKSHIERLLKMEKALADPKVLASRQERRQRRALAQSEA